jgi:hypothetical protein
MSPSEKAYRCQWMIPCSNSSRRISAGVPCASANSPCQRGINMNAAGSTERLGPVPRLYRTPKGLSTPPVGGRASTGPRTRQRGRQSGADRLLLGRATPFGVSRAATFASSTYSTRAISSGIFGRQNRWRRSNQFWWAPPAAPRSARASASPGEGRATSQTRPTDCKAWIVSQATSGSRQPCPWRADAGSA